MNKELVRSVYDATVRLWFRSGASTLASGAPGLPGPSSDDEEWDEDRALLEGAIYTLQDIHKYLYKDVNSL
jgi:hypothetical protein